ncbi:hypothetical protein [Nonomuraea sp. LPB2021202275-12-8]|uniref:hypothetical protein n=1 Tax=Nonomuraea sp. LPB2021202275-12-8 TaxID=3120159 RepID=UPI00300BFEA6
MPPSQRAVQAWDGLNERQRTYMRVFYFADQDAEQFWKGAWARGEDAPPASVWRWLEYGNVGGGTLIELGRLQRALQDAGVRDPGAGSTLEALEQRELIETTTGPSMIGYTLKVKLTTFGRAVCRAGWLDLSRPMAPRRGLLSEALWGMLVDVHKAGPEGLESKYADGAWNRLIEREPEPFLDKTPAEGGSWAWRLRLTDAGRAHYA